MKVRLYKFDDHEESKTAAPHYDELTYDRVETVAMTLFRADDPRPVPAFGRRKPAETLSQVR